MPPVLMKQMWFCAHGGGKFGKRRERSLVCLVYAPELRLWLIFSSTCMWVFNSMLLHKSHDDAEEQLLKWLLVKYLLSFPFPPCSSQPYIYTFSSKKEPFVFQQSIPISDFDISGHIIASERRKIQTN